MKDIKENKNNISISIHSDLLKMIEIYCKENEIKKSKFISDIVMEYFKNKINK